VRGDQQHRYSEFAEASKQTCLSQIIVDSAGFGASVCPANAGFGSGDCAPTVTSSATVSVAMMQSDLLMMIELPTAYRLPPTAY